MQYSYSSVFNKYKQTYCGTAAVSAKKATINLHLAEMTVYLKSMKKKGHINVRGCKVSQGHTERLCDNTCKTSAICQH